MKKVTIYTTQYCPFCLRAKQLLKNKNVDFEEIDLTHKPEEKQALIEKTQWRTVPQIFIGSQFIGGFEELLALEQEGKLNNLLEKD